LSERQPVQNEYRPWLPEAALSGGAVDGLLSTALREWSAHWLARANARPLGTVTPLPSYADLGTGAVWLTLDRDVAIGIPEESRLTLLRLFLDLPPREESVTEADRQLITSLSTLCLDDLCRRLAEMFAPKGVARWTTTDASVMPALAEPRGCAFGVETRSPLIRFVASTAAIINLTRSRLPARPARPALRPISAALASQQVTISAALGRSTITLADMAGLSEGDVLVFDEDMGTPLAIALDGTPVSGGRCTIVEANNRLHLKLLEPVR
jgi:hypothetical protein